MKVKLYLYIVFVFLFIVGGGFGSIYWYLNTKREVNSPCTSCDYGDDQVFNCPANTTDPNCTRLNCQEGCAVYTPLNSQCSPYLCYDISNHDGSVILLVFWAVFSAAFIITPFIFREKKAEQQPLLHV